MIRGKYNRNAHRRQKVLQLLQFVSFCSDILQFLSATPVTFSTVVCATVFTIGNEQYETFVFDRFVLGKEVKRML